MNNVSSNEARHLFRSEMKCEKRQVGKTAPTETLSVIQNAFKALASEDGQFEMNGKKVDVKDLGFHELDSLCKLSRKFFKKQKNLAVSAELLRDIEKVKNTDHFKIHFSNSDGTDECISHGRKLDSVMELICVNEEPEITSGARDGLRVELLVQIRKNAVILKKKRRIARVKKIAVITAGVIASTAAVLGGIPLLLLGSTGVAVILLGITLLPFATYKGVEFVQKRLEKYEDPQEERLWAFEMLSNEESFVEFCNSRGLDPEKVTFEEMVKNRFRPEENLV